MKTKIVISSILFVFLLYVAIYLAGLLPFIAEHKRQFDIHLLANYSWSVLFHPLRNSIEMVRAANPLFYIFVGAAFVMFVYILIKTRQKGYENVGEKYGVQGSSRWVKKSEIFNVPEQIVILNISDVYEDLKDSLKESEAENDG